MKPFYFEDFRPIATPENTFICQKRGKLIAATSEEYVRQAVLDYLIQEHQVKIEHIDVEFAMSKLDNQSNRRADILVSSKNQVVLVVECKAPEVALTDEIFHDQALDYAKSARLPKLIWITNGFENQYYLLEKEKHYERLVELPDFSDPNSLKPIYHRPNYKAWQPLTFEQICDRTFQKALPLEENYAINTDWYEATHADTSVLPAVIRLGEFLFFTKDLPAGTRLGPFVLKEDKNDFFKTIQVPNFKYRTHTRTLVLEETQTGQTLIADFALIVLGKDRAIHLATRLSPNGSGSFALQAKIDKQIRWNENNQAFQLTHHPKKLSMGKLALEGNKADFMRQHAPEILDDTDTFHTPWIDATIAPIDSIPQYIQFLAQWLTYVDVVAKLKAHNKSEKIPPPTKEQRHNVMAIARRLERKDQWKEGIDYVLLHLNEIHSSRREIALKEIFDWAYNMCNDEQMENIIAKVNSESTLYFDFNTRLEKNRGNLEAMHHWAMQHPNKERYHYYWESLILGDFANNHFDEKALETIESAQLLAVASDRLKNYKTLTLWKMNNSHEALANFVEQPVLELEFNFLMDIYSSFLCQFGYWETLQAEVIKTLDKGLPLEKQNINYYTEVLCSLIYSGDFTTGELLGKELSKLAPDNDAIKDYNQLLNWKKGDIMEAFAYFKDLEINIPIFTLCAAAMAKQFGQDDDYQRLLDRASEELKLFTEGIHGFELYSAEIFLAALLEDQKRLTKAIKRAETELIRLDAVKSTLRFLAEGFNRMDLLEKQLLSEI